MPASGVKQKDKPAYTLFAGATAGAIEAFATYPLVEHRDHRLLA